MSKKTSIKIISIFIFCVVSLSTFAQRGSIEGVVIDKLRAETLVGATVVIQGTTNGTITDFDGKFILANLTPGTYNVQVSFISYKPVLIEGIKVEANKASMINVDLEEVTTAIEGVTVTATKRNNTDVAMISAIKTSNIIASGITAQQITRTQDKDASEVIKRVPGISIIEDRFIVVRGLNQRYNSVWINNASTPSSETDQKAFSFDVIPSSMIDNILIAKSPSPELPADFTGGFIKIFTKNMPEKNFFQVGYSTTYNTEDDYSNFQLISKGKYDWLGIDNGERALPDNFPTTLKGLSNSQLATLGKEFNSSWAPKKATAYPEQKININFGRRFQVGSKQIGTITNINYGVSNNSDVKNLTTYLTQFNIGDTPVINYNYSDSSSSRTTKIGILHNWAFFLGNGNKIEFRNLLNINGKNTSIKREGLNYEGRYIRSYQDKYMSRATYSGQLGGEHKYGENDKNKVDWVLGFAYSGKNEPDLKQLRTTLQDDPMFPHYGEYSASIGYSPSVSDAGRLFMRLNEYISSAGVNYDRKIKIGNWEPSIKTGIYSEYKYRVFDTRILGYSKNSANTESVWLPVETIFSPENINTTADGFIIKETTSKSDSYDATNMLFASYVALSTNITGKIKFYGGVRAEYNSLQLDGYDVYNRAVNLQSSHLDLFPSANLTYNFNEKNLIRFATGLSVNRPEFREVAPFYFYNFEEEADFVGNKNLANSYIWNYDIRYEFYPSSSETFSFGFFYKTFKSTIESTYKQASGSRPTYTFDNANEAKSLGVEVELRKSLESIELLKDFFIVANAAYINSDVIFPEGAFFENREMQGQSPFLVNAGIFYSNDKRKLNISAQYNIIGDRLITIGETNQNPTQNKPHIYEKKKHLLDLTISKEFYNSIEFKFGIRNLLNQKTITYFPYLNSSGDADMQMDNKSSSDGISFSFGVTAKF